MKKSLIIITLSVIVVILFKLAIQEQRVELYQSEEPQIIKENQYLEVVELKALKQTSNVSKESEKSISQEQKYQLQNFLRDRGYSEWADVDGEFKEVPFDYHAYDDQSLKDIADSGDRVAQMVFSERAILKQDYVNAEIYAYKSILNGYTKPIKNIISANMHKLGEKKSLGDLESAKLLYIEAMAWFEVASIRNDPFLLKSKSLYKNYSQGLNVNDADRNRIKELGKEFYNKLVSERLANGLDEFDNSFPDG